VGSRDEKLESIQQLDQQFEIVLVEPFEPRVPVNLASIETAYEKQSEQVAIDNDTT